MLKANLVTGFLVCAVASLLAVGPQWLSAQAPARSADTLPAGQAESDELLAQARARIREGRTAEAEAAIRQYLASGHDSESARVLLGLVLYQEHRPADSLREFTRAARVAKPRASELVVVGLDYVDLRDLASANKWMSMAAELDPGNAAIWRYLGGIKYSENRFSEAIDAYQHCLKLRARDLPAEDGIGRSLEGLGRDEEAETAYRTALEWQRTEQSRYPEPLLHLGALLTRLGHTAAAVPLLQKAEELKPQDADEHEQLGEAFAGLGRLKDAQEELEYALRLAPGNSHLHWLLASVYRREGMKEGAERETEAYARLLGSHSSDKLH